MLNASKTRQLPDKNLSRCQHVLHIDGREGNAPAACKTTCPSSPHLRIERTDVLTLVSGRIRVVYLTFIAHRDEMNRYNSMRGMICYRLSTTTNHRWDFFEVEIPFCTQLLNKFSRNNVNSTINFQVQGKMIN